jgi:hypothetical protein
MDCDQPLLRSTIELLDVYTDCLKIVEDLWTDCTSCGVGTPNPGKPHPILERPKKNPMGNMMKEFPK